jgi:hypothetical protein
MVERTYDFFQALRICERVGKGGGTHHEVKFIRRNVGSTAPEVPHFAYLNI